MVPGNLAAGKKPDEGYIAQRAPYDLQLGTGCAKMRATAAGTSDLDGAGNAPGRVRC